MTTLTLMLSHLRPGSAGKVRTHSIAAMAYPGGPGGPIGAGLSSDGVGTNRVLLREIQFLTEYDVLYRNYAHRGGQGIAGCSHQWSDQRCNTEIQQ